MGKGISGLILKALGGKDAVVTITAKELIAPEYLLLQATSPTLLDKITWAPGHFLRFWIPDETAPDTLYQRAYTIARCDPVSKSFDFEIALHNTGGPGRDWVDNVEIGDEIAVTSMGSQPFHLVPDRKGILLIGDSTSLPTINAILETVPESCPVELYLEYQNENELQNPLGSHTMLNVHRVHRDDATSLADAIDDEDWSGWQVWANGEANSLNYVRKRLKETSTLAKHDLHAQAYWQLGKPMGNARRMESRHS